MMRCMMFSCVTGSTGLSKPSVASTLFTWAPPSLTRCHYCQGTGYLMCGNCSGAGSIPLEAMALANAGAGATASSNGFNGSRASPNACCCNVCSGMGKVM